MLLDSLEKKATQGNTDAQCILAYMYAEGRSVPQDNTKAIEWYKKAAKQNEPIALLNLGFMYLKGQGIPQDYEKAIKYFTKAANLGNLEAQVQLSNIYETGYKNGIIAQNTSKAIYWIEKAAKQGHAQSQYEFADKVDEYHPLSENIDRRFDRRAFRRKDEIEEYFTKAAKQGHINAQFYTKNTYNKLRKFAKQSNSKIQNIFALKYEKDDSKKIEWYLKAAEQNYVVAQYNIGTLYLKGNGVKQNYEKALEWFTKAAMQGYADAQYELGSMYEKGNGVEKDYEKALEWYIKAADKRKNQPETTYQYDTYGCWSSYTITKKLRLKDRNTFANIFNDKTYSKDDIEHYSRLAKGNEKLQYKLGYIYEKSKVVPKDYKKAIEWYMKATELKNMKAAYALGRMYEEGNGVPQDYEKAIEWYTKAYYIPAERRLGEMYNKGIGVKRNINNAIECYKEIANGEPYSEDSEELEELIYEKKETNDDI